MPDPDVSQQDRDVVVGLTQSSGNSGPPAQGGSSNAGTPQAPSPFACQISPTGERRIDANGQELVLALCPEFPGLSEGVQQQYFHRWIPVMVADAPPPDPQAMAQQAIARMQLEPITIGTYPGTLEYHENARGFVNHNMWLWSDNSTQHTWGPITRTVTLNGYTLTATAEVHHLIWDMGNGDTVRCHKGEEWNKGKKPNQKAPSCGYQYPKAGTYPITATSHWTINWHGVGQTGTINLELSRTETMRILEWVTLQCAKPGRC